MTASVLVTTSVTDGEKTVHVNSEIAHRGRFGVWYTKSGAYAGLDSAINASQGSVSGLYRGEQS
jgi:hypothetical protein